MSAPASTSRAPGFLWLLAAFVGIVVILALIPKRESIDPRAPERAKNTADIKALQAPLVEKLKLVPGPGSADTLAAGLALVKGSPAKPGPKIAPPAPAAPAPAAAAPVTDKPAAAPAPAPAK